MVKEHARCAAATHASCIVPNWQILMSLGYVCEGGRCQPTTPNELHHTHMAFSEPLQHNTQLLHALRMMRITLVYSMSNVRCHLIMPSDASLPLAAEPRDQPHRQTGARQKHNELQPHNDSFVTKCDTTPKWQGGRKPGLLNVREPSAMVYTKGSAISY
jgi:hypothetical protein